MPEQAENPLFQEPQHLGDGVYAGHDKWGIWLHANDHANPTDRIYLEQCVYMALKQYADKLGWNKL